MKKIIGLALTLILSVGVNSAQISGFSETQTSVISKSSQALFEQGKLDEAIADTEKEVEAEKSLNSADTTSYANSLFDLARLNQDYYFIIRQLFNNKKISPENFRPNSVKMQQAAKDANEEFRLALELNEKGGRAETVQTADIKTDLALLIYNSVGSRESVDESEKFFTESLALNEKVREKDAEETLFVVLKTGDFYYQMDNYEKSLPFYERYIQAVEQKRGKNDSSLVNALHPTANILFATFQEQAATDVIKRIESISGKSELMPKANLDFHLRSKESVANNSKTYNNFQKDLKSYNAKREIEKNSLSGDTVSMMPRIVSIPVNVVVDENGKITEAVAAVPPEANKDLKVKAEREISTWNVRPFLYNGTTRKLRGILYYPAEIFFNPKIR